jgi:gamma-glutamylcyclotransferase (GGCT)/AIG2-like uncharacterized protein YtfP
MRSTRTKQKTAEQSQSVRLFVYGTLKRGHSLHKFLANKGRAQFVGKAKARGRLYQLYGRRYPGAVLTSRAHEFVHGELYQINDPRTTLKLIDRIEGCDEGLFRRRMVDVWTNGSKTKAWTYFYARALDGATPIPTGRYDRRTTAQGN